MIGSPDWDDMDSRLATMQEMLHDGSTASAQAAVRISLGSLRGDLAALRHFAGLKDTPPPAPKAAPNTYDGPLVDNLPKIETRASQVAGFTGNICDQCGGTHMIRSGTCELCQDCGTTTGCS